MSSDAIERKLFNNPADLSQKAPSESKNLIKFYFCCGLRFVYFSRIDIFDRI